MQDWKEKTIVKMLRYAGEGVIEEVCEIDLLKNCRNMKLKIVKVIKNWRFIVILLGLVTIGILVLSLGKFTLTIIVCRLLTNGLS